MKKFIQKLSTNQMFITILGFVIIFSAFGGTVVANGFSEVESNSPEALEKAMEISGDNFGTYNFYVGDQEKSEAKAEPQGEFLEGASLHNNVNPIFTNGLRASINQTQVINSSAQLVGETNNTNSTSTNIGVTKIDHGGVELNWREIDFTDATTTPIALLNPYSADVFMDVFQAFYQNGTTTSELTCGTSSIASLTSDPTDTLIDDISLASSTLGTATTTAYIRNNNGTVSVASGMTDPGTNSQDVILWRSTEYIACYINETGTTGGVTAGNNISSGSVKFHVYR